MRKIDCFGAASRAFLVAEMEVLGAAYWWNFMGVFGADLGVIWWLFDVKNGADFAAAFWVVLGLFC